MKVKDFFKNPWVQAGLWVAACIGVSKIAGKVVEKKHEHEGCCCGCHHDEPHHPHPEEVPVPPAPDKIPEPEPVEPEKTQE